MAAKEKQSNDATRTMRMPSSLLEQSDALFAKLGLSFSEAVRMFLEEAVKTGKIPFRPMAENTVRKKALMREREEDYLDSILNRNKTLLDRLFSSFMPESSGEMSDEGLRDWGNRSGFPKTISLTTLAELYDSKLFAQEPWSGELNYKENVDENNAFDMIMLTKAQTGNIEANLDDTRRKLLTNALNYYINCNADDTDDTDKEDDYE